MDGLLDWYLLGVVAGLGVACGLLAWQRRWVALVPFALALGAATVIVTSALPAWAFAAFFAAVAVSALSLRRLAPAALPAAFVAVSALAFVPAIGYLEAAAAPLLGERLRRRASSRYAGLRVLAKD